MRPSTKPDFTERMRIAANEAEELAQSYPEDVRPFMHQLWLDRGITLIGNEVPERDAWKYRSYQDLVLDLSSGPRHVPIFVPDDIPLMSTGECFYNAYVLATERPDLTYVEGYAQTQFLIVQHAWLEAEDGTIIDPTWGNLDAAEATYLGVRFDTEFVVRHSARTGYTSILKSDWMLDVLALRQGFVTDESGVVVDMEELFS